VQKKTFFGYNKEESRTSAVSISAKKKGALGMKKGPKGRKKECRWMRKKPGESNNPFRNV